MKPNIRHNKRQETKQRKSASSSHPLHSYKTFLRFYICLGIWILGFSPSLNAARTKENVFSEKDEKIMNVKSATQRVSSPQLLSSRQSPMQYIFSIETYQLRGSFQQTGVRRMEYSDVGTLVIPSFETRWHLSDHFSHSLARESQVMTFTSQKKESESSSEMRVNEFRENEKRLSEKGLAEKGVADKGLAEKRLSERNSGEKIPMQNVLDEIHYGVLLSLAYNEHPLSSQSPTGIPYKDTRLSSLWVRSGVFYEKPIPNPFQDKVPWYVGVQWTLGKYYEVQSSNSSYARQMVQPVEMEGSLSITRIPFLLGVKYRMPLGQISLDRFSTDPSPSNETLSSLHIAPWTVQIGFSTEK